MQVRLALALGFFLVGVAVAKPVAVKKHGLTVDDMLAMERVSEPTVSPDGKWAVYALRTTEVAENLGRHDLWLVATDGATAARRLTSHPDRDGGARFSPDGKSIFFLSTRSGSSQVWRIAVDGGEAEQVTKLPVDVSLVMPMADGRLLLGMDVYPSLATLEETAKRDQEKSKNKSKAMAFDTLLFRHWDSWEDGKRGHLFIYKEGSPPRDLMAGLDIDSPSHPFGGAEDLAISPDGKTVIYTAKNVGREAAWSTNFDLFAVPVEGGKAENLTAGNPATDSTPVFSPDGKTLAYLAMARPGFEADRRRIVLYDWASKKSRTLTDGWDRSPDEIAWARDGKRLLVTATHVGNNALFTVDVKNGEVATLADKGYHGGISSLPDGVLYAKDTFVAPAELFVRRGPVGAETRLTNHNQARVAAIEWGAFEQFSFKGAKGDTVYGYVVKPAGHKGEKVPMALLIHGGPQGSFENHFHYRWNAQAFAGHGLGVVIIDFHGSTGYGQAFTDAIRNDWGGKPFEDLMLGLDHALKAFPFLDGKRAVALGASYGGYMINLINGKSDRFRALICHDGNLDETMAYYDTEELWFPEWEHGGTPWDNPAGYAQQSPLALVSKWKTPTLVIHGGQDFRVVETQGMSTFTALQRRGIPSRFLYFPDENHWVLKPQNSKRWHQEVLAWIDRYTK